MTGRPDHGAGRRPPRAARTPDDGGFAIVLVLYLMVFASLAMIVVIGAVTAELVPTYRESKGARTLAAAEAGAAAATSLIRDATSPQPGGGVSGDIRELPCTSPARPLTGSVPGATGLGYSVEIRYFTADPTGQTAAWRTANTLVCTTGLGPADVPLYALVVARATETSPNAFRAMIGNRTVEAVYTFVRGDQALLGGPVQTYDAATPLCWQASAVPPATGSTITLQNCQAGSALQKFSYRSDYTLVLTNSQNSDGTGGMCLTATSSYTALTFQPCGPPGWDRTNPTYTTQRWAYNDNGQFQGIDGAATGLYPASCLSTGGVYIRGTVVAVRPCGGASRWTPDPTVGAGAAGPPTLQLINFKEYGRCLDVTNQNVNSSFLIDYPCKQDPTSTVRWNQRWVWDGPGTRQFQSTYNNTLYCLTTSASPNGRVVVRPCNNGLSSQRWTMTGDTGNRSTSYLVTDSAGRCMSLGPPDITLPAWSTIVVADCDGSPEQKWNAPPTATRGGVGAHRELSGGRP